MTSRRQLERRVDELAAEHSGRAFADAIREYSQTLRDDEKEQLQRILVERSVDFDQAVMERVDARGWFRRQWDRATTSSPPGTERDR
jgi:hypothetical protein